MAGAEKPFLDTNILVYAFSTADRRKAKAEQLVLAEGTIGVQTLNEFVRVTVGRFRYPWEDVLRWLRAIRELCPLPVPLTNRVHMRGLVIAQTTGYHIYDALMLAAALESGCSVFYSEDLQDGQTIEGLTIRNPFV